jgi:TnpA family transposase
MAPRRRSDEAQLIFATERRTALLTYNAQDFIPLARAWYRDGREHAGIVISEQMSQGRLGELLRRVLRLLNTVTAENMQNRIVFLQQFK